MFNDWEFLDRFAAAADAGFKTVEYLFPYDYPPDLLASMLERTGLTQALFNFDAGDFSGGDRGFAALIGREQEFERSLATGLRYAQAIRPRYLHLMAGIADSHDIAARERYKSSVKHAALVLAQHDIGVTIEPINTRDMPGYFLNNIDFAANLIAELGLPNVKLQFDIYHCQIIHGDLTMRLRKYIDLIGHIQIASVPCRNEPLNGEINYAFIFDELGRLGYQGAVGCEYRPRDGTLNGLGWFEPYRV